jgi:hypothetical protein
MFFFSLLVGIVLRGPENNYTMEVNVCTAHMAGSEQLEGLCFYVSFSCLLCS